MELAYTTRPYREFNETVAKIEEITATKGLRVLHIHDVRATLQEKGFERGLSRSLRSAMPDSLIRP
jgi:uncharacterized protein (DUF302 family)